LPAIEGRRRERERPIVWEHEGNRAVRVGPWKLVSEHPGKWELYNMDEDRTELNDLAGGDPARIGEMAGIYEEWAERCGVLPWPVDPDQRPSNMRGEHTNISRLASR
jgi:arylsulfatase